MTLKYRLLEILIALISGFLCLELTVGHSVLDPTNVAWLLNGGDYQQHYLGWEFFRLEPLLQFPLGSLQKLGTGVLPSVVYTDSLPLFAIPLKAIFSLIGFTEFFQYSGLWIFSCFSLQVFFARRCLKLMGCSSVGACALSFVVGLSPTLLFRLAGHDYPVGHLALMGQWLLLWSINLTLLRHCSIRSWSWLLFLALATHAYLFAMCAALFFADFLNKEPRLARPRIKRGLLLLLCLLILEALSIGYFSSSSSAYADTGYGTYKWNLLSWFNGSPNWSALLRLWTVDNGEYEGFSYLGFLPVFSLLFCCRRNNRLYLRSILLSHWEVWLASVLMAAFAMTLSIGFGPFQFPISGLPFPLSLIGQTFRASGRFIWPLYYLVSLTLLSMLDRAIRRVASRKPLYYFVLSFLVLIAFWDLSPALSQLRLSHSPPHSVSSCPIALDSDGLKVHSIPVRNRPENWSYWQWFALCNEASTSIGNFARFDDKQASLLDRRLRSELSSSRPDPNTIYIVNDLDFLVGLNLPKLFVNGSWIAGAKPMILSVSRLLEPSKPVPGESYE
ncbi:DUF6311 domain-containing protein [Synechococcus sp. W4D4]|uniref:DUF6311 domain-containing protein n=1 Tax=Synechococcus sp. W4D4 TaxID=3392294 RepID=UPI0039EA1B52